MQFKMAPNSLFASLLRSPWWMSLLLALAFVAAARALLPLAYWVFGALGALPFFAISAIVAKRQWSAPRPADVQAVLSAAGAMAWRDFSAQLESALQQAGYRTQRAEQVAFDWSMQKNGQTTLVAAKRWKAAHHGIDAVQSLHAAMLEQEAGACIYVALGALSEQAQSFAKAHTVQVVSGADLATLLKGLPQKK